MTEPKWQEFEKLVEQTYKKLSPEAKIEHDVKIKGLETKTDRQIDICIRNNVAGHDILIIVQCKDLSRKADINVVGEFASVVRDVRANKGVLVCNAGFTDKAIEYAKNRGIDVFGVYDSRVETCGILIKFPALWIDLVPIFNVEVKGTGRIRIPINQEEWLLKYKDYPACSLRDLSRRLWNTKFFEHSSGERSYKLSDDVFFVTQEGEYSVELTFNVKVREHYYFKNIQLSETEGLIDFAEGSYITKDFYIEFDSTELGKTWKEIQDPKKLDVIPAFIFGTAPVFTESM